MKRRIAPPVGIQARKLRKIRRFSQTPGRSKVARCHASAMSKSHARRSRSYRWHTYGAWCASIDRQ